MMIRLEFSESDSESPRIYTFLRDHIRLGTADGCEVPFPGSTEEILEARIELRDGQGFLVPVKGKLRVNGVEIAQEVTVESGDQLTLGEVTCTFWLVPLPVPMHSRKLSGLEWTTLGLIALLALGQVYFLLVPSISWRGQVDADILRPTPTPIPSPTPLPTAEGTPTPTPSPTPIPTPTATPTPLPTVTPTPPPRPTATPVPATQGKTADELSQEALKLMKQGQGLAAERLNEQALQMEPENVNALAARARIYEAQSRFKEAIEAWELVLEKAPATSPYVREGQVEIRLLRARLRRLDRTVPPNATPTPTKFVPEPPPFVPLPKQQSPLGVIDLKTVRWAETDNVSEKRMVSFTLQHQASSPRVLPGTAQIRVTYYEEAGNRIRRAQIPQSSITYDLTKGLGGGKTYGPIEAAYIRPGQPGQGGVKYFGCIIEVLIDGKVVETIADPPLLQDLIKPAE